MDTIILYKKDSKGRVNVWDVRVERNGNHTASIISVSGLLDGKLTLTSENVLVGKNTGKANATTAYEQAVLQAKAKVEKKQQGGYVGSLEEVRDSGTNGAGLAECMLAHKFSPVKKAGHYTLEDLKVLGKPIMVQRKKDGNRCHPIVNESGVKFYTRKGLPFAYDFPHIARQLKFAYDLLGLVGSYTLDGELFTNAFSFNKLNGILKKKTLLPEHTELLDQVNFHLYDVFLPVNYPARYAFLEKLAGGAAQSSHVILEHSYLIEQASNEAIDDLLSRFLEEGEEGAMIRLLDRPYENKRTTQLLKYKIFDDFEFQVIGMEEHIQGGMVGNFILRAPSGLKDRDGRAKTEFRAGTRMSQEESAEMWQHQEQYIGQYATVRYFGLSEYGVPRFPKVTAFRSDV